MIDLTNKKAKQKAQLKSKELVKIKLSKFKKDDFDIEIVGDIKEIEVNGQHGIELFATAYKNGKQCGFGKDGSIEIERFRFFNPPVLVDDENGDIIREWTDEETKEIKQRKLKYDPEQAIKESLAHTLSLVAKDNKNIVKGKIGNTTSTFYPQAGSGGGNVTCDGDLIVQSRASWDNAHDATTADVVRTTSTNEGTSLTNNNGLFFIYRTVYHYDTSSIPDTDNIDSSTFSVYVTGKNNADVDAYGYIGVVQSQTASDNTLVAADFDNVGDSIDNPTQGATGISLASITTSAYNDFSLNATGIGWISKTGVTKLGTREGHDIEDVSPTGLNRWVIYFADQTGTATDPKLVVEHSAATTDTGNFFQLF